MMTETLKRNSDSQTREIKIMELEHAMRTADDETFWKLAEQWQKIAEQEYRDSRRWEQKPR